MAQSVLKLSGLDWKVPDFSTISRRQKNLAVTIGAHPTTTRLHLLVDSTGIKMLGEGEWKTKKHGTDYRRQWRKVHLGIDVDTLEIRAIEVSDNGTGDAPMLPCLLDQIDTDEMIARVSGDGAYDTKDCHAAIERRGAPAIIPTRRNASRGKIDVLAPRPVTPSWMPHAGLAAKSGRSGPGIIDAVLWAVSPRPHHDIGHDPAAIILKELVRHHENALGQRTFLIPSRSEK